MRGTFPVRTLLAAASFVAFAAPTSAQAPVLRVQGPDGESQVPLAIGRGFAAVPVSSLGLLGWQAERTAIGAALLSAAGERVEVRDGTPFLDWGDEVLQLVDAPFFEAGELHLPLQFLTDFLPWRGGGAYTFEAGRMLLTWDAPAARAQVPTGPRLVIIDAGHGGEDPGTISRSGVREKNVALGVAQAMAEALRDDPDVEVVMIRDGDTFVPVWDRGALATELKGDRYGIFVSIHANSAASASSPARGFETYFLSEARTEHERRVAAIENAPLGVTAPPDGGGEDLDFILRELKNLDQQHWSSLLAEFVQDEVRTIHPGPNRGVKQAPLAVLTNAIMPSVLVEIGYLSHPEEARLLAQPTFQREAGQAIARAVGRFFQRYPPGSGHGGGEDR